MDENYDLFFSNGKKVMQIKMSKDFEEIEKQIFQKIGVKLYEGDLNFVEKNKIKKINKSTQIKKENFKEKVLESLGKEPEKKVFVYKLSKIRVSRRLVMMIEYAAAIIPIIIFYFYSQKIFPKNEKFLKLFKKMGEKALEGYDFKKNTVRILMLFHFLKRLFESLFVHRFSMDRVGASFLFGNVLYYYLFSFIINFELNFPSSKIPFFKIDFGSLKSSIFLFFFVFFEMMNFMCHWTLSKLRKSSKDSSIKSYPFSSLLFKFVAFPHYLFEILSWLSLYFLTDLYSILIFAIASASILIFKAIKKNNNSKKMIKGYPSDLKAIIPFLI